MRCRSRNMTARPRRRWAPRSPITSAPSPPVVPMWFTGTLLGATLGTAIPPGFALDFALPITFLAMIAPMLRTLAHVAATVTSVVCALALAGLPYHAGAAAGRDRRDDRRRKGSKPVGRTEAGAMGLSDSYVWILIALIGFGSFLLRFSFLRADRQSRPAAMAAAPSALYASRGAAGARRARRPVARSDRRASRSGPG